MILQLVEGLSQIHSKKIGHRDLNLENIGVHDNILKIRNLAFSKYSDQDFASSFLGVSPYYPPELLEIDQDNYSVVYDIYKIDIFSLGVVIFKIAEFRFPFIFQSQNVSQRIEVIKKGPNFTNLIPREQPYSKDFYDLIQKMLKFNP